MSLVSVAEVTALVGTDLGTTDLQLIINREEQWLARRIGQLAGERTNTFYPRRLREPIFLRRPAAYEPDDGPTITLTTSAATDDLLDSIGHGVNNGDQVEFATLSGGAGLVVNTTYYVVTATANSFQISDTLGGPAKNFTTDITAGTLHKVAIGITVTDGDDTLVFGDDSGEIRLLYGGTVIEKLEVYWTGGWDGLSGAVGVTWTPADTEEVKAAIIDLIRLRITDTGYISERIGQYSYQQAQTPGAREVTRRAIVTGLLIRPPYRSERLVSAVHT